MNFRIKPIDRVKDMWILEERCFGIFWKYIGCDSERVVQKMSDNLNASGGKVAFGYVPNRERKSANAGISEHTGGKDSQ